MFSNFQFSVEHALQRDTAGVQAAIRLAIDFKYAFPLAAIGIKGGSETFVSIPPPHGGMTGWVYFHAALRGFYFRWFDGQWFKCCYHCGTIAWSEHASYSERHACDTLAFASLSRRRWFALARRATAFGSLNASVRALAMPSATIIWNAPSLVAR